LSGNPFLLVLKFNLTEIVCKKDWERKADKAAQIIIQYWRNDAQRGIVFNSLFLILKFWK